MQGGKKREYQIAQRGRRFKATKGRSKMVRKGEYYRKDSVQAGMTDARLNPRIPLRKFRFATEAEG
jgi:hypothetical protein